MAFFCKDLLTMAIATESPAIWIVNPLAGRVRPKMGPLAATVDWPSHALIVRRIALTLAVAFGAFGQLALAAPGPFTFPASPKQQAVLATGSAYNYVLNVGGTLDEFNTTNYRAHYGAYRQVMRGFQPNQYLMIENVGTSNVVDPQITVNGRRQWFSAESIVNSVTRPGMADAHKAMALFEHVASYDTSCHDNNRRVGPELPEDETNLNVGQFQELADPVKAANAYYCSGCSQLSSNLVVLARKAGFQARVLWVSPSDRYKNHAVAEIYYDNDWHVFDPDRRAFYLEGDNQTVASYRELHQQPQLVARTHLGGFASKGVGPSLAKEFGMHGNPKEMPVDTNWESDMGMTLRPGEKFVWRWDSDGKFRVGNNPRNNNLEPSQLANGKLIYQPRLEEGLRATSATDQKNLTTLSGRRGTLRLVPQKPGEESQVTYRVESPYPIVGGQIGANVNRSHSADEVSIQISRDGKTWQDAWKSTELGERNALIPIDRLLDAKYREPIYSYFVRYKVKQTRASAPVSLADLYLETDVQMARTSLPSLSVGENKVEYRSAAQGSSGTVRISHGWKESSATIPPKAPQKPVAPAPNQVVDAATLYLSWQAAVDPRGEAIVGYHVQVSSRSDMLHPVSPSLDRMTYNNSTTWQVPTGWLQAGTDYFWRVRGLDSWGAWSNWSDTWRFQIARSPRAAVPVPDPAVSIGHMALVCLGAASLNRSRSSRSAVSNP